jgi:propanediol dehydratase small subunit
MLDDISVSAVLASDVDSKEFRVDATLCFEGDRRMELSGRDRLAVVGLIARDLVEEPDQSRPRKRDAAACI